MLPHDLLDHSAPPSLASSPRRFFSPRSSRLRASLLPTPSLSPSLAPSISLPSPPLSPSSSSSLPPLRWLPLRRLSSKLAASIKLYGHPSVVAVRGIICIGTSNGVVLVFDYSQALKSVCRVQDFISPVTAIDISSDHTFLAVGYQNGAIHLFDLSSTDIPARSVSPVDISQVKQDLADGHISSSSITHISLLPSRHTALVSSDDFGMVFYHALGKVLGLDNTTVDRILGRYPSGDLQQRKPSPPILSLATLPLGTLPHPSDTHVFVALLTPTKLIVAGLKPSLRTWYKHLRPNIPKLHHDKNAGALAWFPPVSDSASSSSPSDPILAFSWDTNVSFLQLKQSGTPNDSSSIGYDFVNFANWSTSDPVLSIHWINNKIIALVMRFNMELVNIALHVSLGKAPLDLSILPQFNLTDPLKSSELNTDGQKLARSMRAYKGRLFLLTSNDLLVASMTSWADRVLALVNRGEIIQAIQVMTAYHRGEGDAASTMNLPEDLPKRQEIVQPKLREILGAALDYVFSEERMYDGTHAAHHGPGVDRTHLFQGLVSACVLACIEINSLDFIFDEMAERYREHGLQDMFLTSLEPFLLSKQIELPPTWIIQKLLEMHDRKNESLEVEKIICTVHPACLDINQATKLSLRRDLYDALANVHVRALNDAVSPLVHFFKLVRELLQPTRSLVFSSHSYSEYGAKSTTSTSNFSFGDDSAMIEPDELAASTERKSFLAYKVFSYLGDTLCGLVYPNKEPLEPSDLAINARNTLYSFLFSGKTLVWPPQHGSLVLTTSDDDNAMEPTHPYLRLLLRFDTEATLDMLDRALEDSYLDDNEVAGKPVNRQMIVNLVIDIIMSSQQQQQFQHDSSSPSSQRQQEETDRLFLYIFVARSLPKYPQFILLPSSTLHRILVGLCREGDMSTLNDRQLAVEYLLSVYTPDDSLDALARCREASFHRVVRSLLKSEKRWAEMIDTCFIDRDLLPPRLLGDDGDYYNDIIVTTTTEIFSVLTGILDAARSSSMSPSTLSKTDAWTSFLKGITILVECDLRMTVELVEKFFPDVHKDAIGQLDNSRPKFDYLVELYGISSSTAASIKKISGVRRRREYRGDEDKGLLEDYLQLMCQFEPTWVSVFLVSRNGEQIDQELARNICKEGEVYDAVVLSLGREGRDSKDALDYARELVYSRVEMINSMKIDIGNDIAEGKRRKKRRTFFNQMFSIAEAGVEVCEKKGGGEEGWSVMLRCLVEIWRSVDGENEERREEDNEIMEKAEKVLMGGLSRMEQCEGQEKMRLGRLLKRVVEESNNGGKRRRRYVEYRRIVEKMVEMSGDGERRLELAERVMERDLFELVEELEGKKRRGWRPDMKTCVWCGGRVCGPEAFSTMNWRRGSVGGVGGGVGNDESYYENNGDDSYHYRQDQLQQQQQQQPLYSSNSYGAGESPTVPLTPHTPIEEIVPPPRARMKLRTSIKGKEVDESEIEEGVFLNEMQMQVDTGGGGEDENNANGTGGGGYFGGQETGVVVIGDGRVYHSSCWQLFSRIS